MFHLIIIILRAGCRTKIEREGEQVVRICPRCHNATVYASKSTRWFSLCWIPIVPVSQKHLLNCEICQWREPLSKNNASQSLPTYTEAGNLPPAQPAYQPDQTVLKVWSIRDAGSAAGLRVSRSPYLYLGQLLPLNHMFFGRLTQTFTNTFLR